MAIDAATALDDVSWTARGATPHPLAPGVKVHRLAIRPMIITGRSIPAGQLTGLRRSRFGSSTERLLIRLVVDQVRPNWFVGIRTQDAIERSSLASFSRN